MKYSKGTANISISMPGELAEKLNILAERSGIPRNRIVVMAIANFMRTNAAKEMAEGKRSAQNE